MTARVNASVRSAARRSAGTRAAAEPAPARPGLSFSTLGETALTARPRAALFEVDGTVYSMPQTVPAGYAISLLTVVRGLPDKAAQAVYLVRELAGQDAVAALLASDAGADGWRQVIDEIWPRVFGQLEGLTSGN